MQVSCLSCFRIYIKKNLYKLFKNEIVVQLILRLSAILATHPLSDALLKSANFYMLFSYMIICFMYLKFLIDFGLILAEADVKETIFVD